MLQQPDEPVRTRFRTPTVGPELRMVEEALAVGLSGLPPGRRVVFKEPEIEFSFPDIVVAVQRGGVPLSPARRGLGAQHFRVLNHLHARRARAAQPISAVIDALCLAPRRAHTIIDELLNAGLVTTTKAGGVRPVPVADAFGLSAIVAVEAKMSNWRGAINQAVRNTWFASHSYVLLPARRVREGALDAASSLGIGVIAFDGRRCETIARAVRQPLPTSYAAWLVDEWAKALVAVKPGATNLPL